MSLNETTVTVFSFGKNSKNTLLFIYIVNDNVKVWACDCLIPCFIYICKAFGKCKNLSNICALLTQNLSLIFNNISIYLFVEVLKLELLRSVLFLHVVMTKNREPLVGFMLVLGDLPVANWTCFNRSPWFLFNISPEHVL